MDECFEKTKASLPVKVSYQKGQKILYKGKAAQIIEVQPVFTIMINSTSHVICGNVLDEVRPYVSES